MSKDDQAPATKKDLRELEDRIKLYFDTANENLVHDFQGIFKDRLEQHDDRLRRLEQRAGFARV